MAETVTITEYIDRVVTETVTVKFDILEEGASKVKHGLTSLFVLIISLLGLIALAVLGYTMYSAFSYINGVMQEKLQNQDRFKISQSGINLKVHRHTKEEKLEKARKMAAKVWATENPDSGKIE